MNVDHAKSAPGIDLVAVFAGAGAEPVEGRAPDEKNADPDSTEPAFADVFASAAHALNGTAPALQSLPFTVPDAAFESNQDATAEDEGEGTSAPMSVEEAFGGAHSIGRSNEAATNRRAQWAQISAALTAGQGVDSAAGAAASIDGDTSGDAMGAPVRGDLGAPPSFNIHSKLDVDVHVKPSVETSFASAVARESKTVARAGISTGSPPGLAAPADSRDEPAVDGRALQGHANSKLTGGPAPAQTTAPSLAQHAADATRIDAAEAPEEIASEGEADSAEADPRDPSPGGEHSEPSPQEPRGTALARTVESEPAHELRAFAAPNTTAAVQAFSDPSGAAHLGHGSWKAASLAPADSAATARSEPGRETPLAWTPQIHHELAAKARSFLDRGEAEIRITLDPPSLGRLTITLEIAPGRVAAHLVATNAHAAALLDRDRDDLVRAFESQGIDDVSVHVASERSFREGSEPHERRSPRDSFGEPESFAPPEDEPSTEARPARRSAVDLVA